MAHLEKHTKTQTKGTERHCNNKDTRDRQDHIDHDRTKDNYNLMARDISPTEYLEQRLDEVHHLDRADLKVTADWIVTLPEGWKGDSREFFVHTVDFLNNQYGAENGIFATVHKDEYRDHMHYSFIPVTKDLNPKHDKDEKVCAKEVLTKQHMRDFHPALQEHLREKMPNRDEREIKVVGIEKDRVKDRSLTQFKAFKEQERVDRFKGELDRQEVNQLSRENDIEERQERSQGYTDYFKAIDNYCNEHGLTEMQYQRELYLQRLDPDKQLPEPEHLNPDRTEQERADIAREYQLTNREPEYEKEPSKEYEREEPER